MKTFRALAPWRAASQYRSAAEAFRAGRETAAGLRRAGVHATFAPVLDLPDGPLGSRQFAKPEYGVAFARGLGAAACPKHFPGLGSTAKSTDVARVYGVLRSQDLAPFRTAIRAGVPCVMVGPRDLPAARAAAGIVRAEDLRAAAPARLPRRRDHRLDRRPRQPIRPVLGAARASRRRRHGADDERTGRGAGSSMPSCRSRAPASWTRSSCGSAATGGRWRHRHRDGLPPRSCRSHRPRGRSGGAGPVARPRRSSRACRARRHRSRARRRRRGSRRAPPVRARRPATRRGRSASCPSATVHPDDRERRGLRPRGRLRLRRRLHDQRDPSRGGAAVDRRRDDARARACPASPASCSTRRGTGVDGRRSAACRRP